jgi:2-oxo-4-hydroxy-4-carboxy-5-ureidoimidazoline decarboxylase
VVDPARGAEAYAWLDALPAEGDGGARAALTRCCGSRRWIDGMLARRPFGSAAAMHAAAHAVWDALDRADYLEAFSHHPVIGADLADLRARFPTTRAWSESEQAGVAQADDATLRDLQEANRIYRDRFGHIFIVCASGLTAREMLARLRARLPNDPGVEIRVAAAEQAKITDLRLEKLGA